MKIEMKYPVRFIAIILAAIIIIVIPVGVLLRQGIDSFVINNFVSNTKQYNHVLEKSILNIQEAISYDVSAFASDEVVKMVNGSIQTYMDSSVIKEMESYKAGGIEQEIFERFRHYGLTHPNTVNIFLGTEQGGYIIWPDQTAPSHYDPRTRPWYKTALTDPDSVLQTDPYTNLTTKAIDISAVKAIKNDEGKTIGVVGIDLAFGGLSAAINELKNQQNQQFILVHSTGLIALDNMNPTGQYTQLNQLTEKKMPGITKLKNNGAIERMVFNEVPYVAYSEKILENRWLLITFIRDEELFNQSYGLIQTLLFGSGAILLGLIILIIGGGYLFFWNFSLQKIVTSRTQELQIMIDGLIEKDTAARSSEARYRNLVDNIPGAVYRCIPGRPWKMIHISNEVELITGYPAEQFIKEEGLPWEAIIMPDDVQMVDEMATEDESGYFQIVYRIVHQNGSIKWVFERGRRIVDDDGATFMDGIIFDYTERKVAEDEVKVLYDELEKRVEARTRELTAAMTQLVEQEKMASLGGIVSGVAHEVNTPLGIGVTLASYIKKLTHEGLIAFENGSMTKNQLQALFDNLMESSELMDSNLNRAAELISSFKQISVNQSIDEMTAFKPYDYIQMILTSLRHEYKNTQHKIELEIPKDFEVVSYAGAYSQIFTNFIMNTLIHGFKGVEEGRIMISIKRFQDHYQIVYQDNGIGISMENINRIFEPFFTTNRQNGGSGLGLHIVYKLVTQKLEGTISCQSELGQGVMFTLELPYHLSNTPEYHLIKN